MSGTIAPNRTPLSARSLATVFAQLRGEGRIGLVPFIPAGYPDLETTRQTLLAMQAGGASAIEVGIPFSDPVADGPVIQEAFTHALAHKLKVSEVLQSVAAVRAQLNLPLIAMVSYSVVHRYGLERFISDSAFAGFDALILPDLPPPEAQRVCARVRAGGLDTILMVAPTTSPIRRREIAGLSSGFVYYLSLSGITGERAELPADLVDNLCQLRGLTDLPLCVGFGISSSRHVAQLIGQADGAIVGSLVVRTMQKHLEAGPGTIASAVGKLCRELLSGVITSPDVGR